MKLSKYNIICENGNQTLVYNTLTSAFISVKSSDWKDLLETNADDVPQNVVEKLLAMGIAVDDPNTQMLQFKYRFYKNAFETKTPFLYIAPTMRCNFDCSYCFEQGNKDQGLMSEDVARKLVAFLQANNKKEVQIVWFGGEPMLGFDRILTICDCLEEAQIKYTSSMITNGSLFSEKNISCLSKLHLQYIQFSMDGVGDAHDKRRCFIGGKPTFEIIMRNLERILTTTDIPVCIQVTVDHENPTAYEDMKEYCNANFGEFINKQRLQIGFNNVQDRTGFDTNNVCFTTEELLSAEIDKMKNSADTCFKLPMLSNPCMYRASWYYAIDAEGNLYKCIEHLGNPLERIGTIKEDNLSLKKLALSAFQEDAFSDPECVNCAVFPICGGGCPLDRIKKARGIPREICSKYKTGLAKILPIAYDKIYAHNNK